MKLYTFPLAPNAARLEYYLQEKGLEIDETIVDLTKGEQNTPAGLMLSLLLRLAMKRR